jgi:hypothetical protein
MRNKSVICRNGYPLNASSDDAGICDSINRRSICAKG